METAATSSSLEAAEVDTSESSPIAPSSWRAEYLAAAEQFANDQYIECIDATKRNLAVSDLSPYFRMKNLLLLACAEDDWYAKERCRRETEALWGAVRGMEGDDDESSIERFGEIRTDLDQLAEYQKEDAPPEIDYVRLFELWESTDDEDGMSYSESEVEEGILADVTGSAGVVSEHGEVHGEEHEAEGDDGDDLTITMEGITISQQTPLADFQDLQISKAVESKAEEGSSTTSLAELGSVSVTVVANKHPRVAKGTAAGFDDTPERVPRYMLPTAASSRRASGFPNKKGQGK